MTALQGGGYFHPTLVVLKTLKAVKLRLPQTLIRFNHTKTQLMINCRVDVAVAERVLDDLEALEPYMHGWMRFFRDDQPINFGPEKPA